jgi:hypothetical protein
MSINAGIGSKTSIGDLVMMGSTPEGLQRLRSIANGPPNPTYPGHLVVAALAQIKSIQDAATQPQPQGTVKDQLLASLQPKPMPTPPSAMGIGAMARPMPPRMPPQGPPQMPQQPPVQGMAGGGEVKSFMDRMSDDSLLGMIRAWRDRTSALTDKPYKEEDIPDISPTKPTLPPMQDLPIPEVVIEGLKQKVDSGPKPDPITAARISASASQRGVGSLGGKPQSLSPYDSKIPDAPDPKSFQLNIPKNQALIDAAAKFSKPDEARMKELRAAEENAGLAAFGAGMVKPGGSFGGVFAGAARDYVNTKEAKAEKRREYEDKREALAMQLGIKVGDDAREDFIKNSEYGDKKSNQAWERGMAQVDVKMKGTHYANQEILEREKIAMQRDAHNLAAAIRRDGLNQTNQAKLERLYQTAQEVAIKHAEAVYGKTDSTTNLLSPEKIVEKQRLIENVFKQEYSRLNEIFGRDGSGGVPAAAAGNVRRDYTK